MRTRLARRRIESEEQTLEFQVLEQSYKKGLLSCTSGRLLPVLSCPNIGQATAVNCYCAPSDVAYHGFCLLIVVITLMTDVRQRIIESVFLKRNATTNLEETYVAHVKIWEDAAPDTGARKPRYILLSRMSIVKLLPETLDK